MRKNMLALLTVLTISVSTVFAFTTSPVQSGVNQQAQSRVEQEAARLYSTLAPLTMSERRKVFSESSSEMKSELWKAHFRSYLSKSDLTDAQKEVIQSALSWVSPRHYDIPKDSPEFEENVHKPAQRLEQKFKEVFSRELAREIVSLLGGPEPKTVGAATATSQPVVRKIASSVENKKASGVSKSKPGAVSQSPTCNCSTASDYCGEWYECHNEGCRRPFWDMCGFMGLYTCNGECHAVIDNEDD